MIDFTKSFNKGIQSAEIADSNKLEIGSVFEELNRQLESVSHGKIRISREKFYEPTHPLKVALFEPKKYYLAIAAENPKAESSVTKELAKWQMDRAGYPCKITLGSDEIYCEDKGALEYGLSEVLQDPVVGDILHKLMNLPEKNELLLDEKGGSPPEENA
ncbi:hypothetical protein ACJJIW_18600 [Microbulbifer sp. JMSA004]|uniref:hypothetical protein n=1 Tax=Microbulbifer sp. JMSA004 TaxID=3243370 RepID=UPI00403940FD